MSSEQGSREKPGAAFLRGQLEKMRPLFEPGGRLEKLYPIFEAQETFLFTPDKVTRGGPHARDAIDIKRVMILVVAALMPAVLFGMYNAGHQYYAASGLEHPGFAGAFLRGAGIVLPIIFVSYLVGGLWEVLFSVVRKHEINEGFLVTGLLFPLTLPPTIPLWQVAAGITFGVVIGKEIFGGTGYNILNPALTARAFLFFAYPAQIVGDEVWASTQAGTMADGYSGATPLGIAALVPSGPRAAVTEALTEAGYTWTSMFGGLIPGSIAETSAIPILIGAAILILTGVGAWRIMAAGVLGLFVGALLMNLTPDHFKAFTKVPFHYHLVMGSFLFGIVFMATDPVSAARTEPGKWIYGFLIGLLVVIIRVANPAFPEGVMLSILFMNVMAPLIDQCVLRVHMRRREAYLRKFSYAQG